MTQLLVILAAACWLQSSWKNVMTQKNIHSLIVTSVQRVNTWKYNSASRNMTVFNHQHVYLLLSFLGTNPVDLFEDILRLLHFRTCVFPDYVDGGSVFELFLLQASVTCNMNHHCFSHSRALLQKLFLSTVSVPVLIQWKWENNVVVF